MNERSAAIYGRRGSLFVIAKVETEKGLRLEDGPCARLAAEAPMDEIGRAVREALSRSGRVIPHPVTWKNPDLDSPVLEAAGVKRWATFRKGARYVSAELHGDEMVLFSTANEGRDGFGFLADEVRMPAAVDDAALGRAVKRALAVCK